MQYPGPDIPVNQIMRSSVSTSIPINGALYLYLAGPLSLLAYA